MRRRGYFTREGVRKTCQNDHYERSKRRKSRSYGNVPRRHRKSETEIRESDKGAKMIINAVVKTMYAVADAYSLVVGTAMTWAELAVEKAPVTTAVVTALVINHFFL